MELNEREKRFCKEYVACKFNGTQAAINAGYSKKTARITASKLLTKANIQEFLSELVAKDEQKLGINVSKERTLKEIMHLAFSDIRDFYDSDGRLKDISDLDDASAAALAGFEIEDIQSDGLTIGTIKKIKRWDKTKALEMLAKINKLYTDAPTQNTNVTPFSKDQVKEIIKAIRDTRST